MTARCPCVQRAPRAPGRTSPGLPALRLHGQQPEDGRVPQVPGRLIVGVDDLLDCRSALEFAAREAASIACRVEIVHVRPAGSPEAPAMSEQARMLVQGMSEAGVEATVAVPSGPVEQVLVGLSRG